MSYDQNSRRGYGQRDVRQEINEQQHRQPTRSRQPVQPPSVVEMLEIIMDDLVEIKQSLRRLEHQQQQPLLQLPTFDTRTITATPQRNDLLFDPSLTRN